MSSSHNIPDSSNLNATASAATTAVTTAATTATGGVATIAIGDAFKAIAGYLNAPPSTSEANATILGAIQKFNELVAAVNAVAA